MKDEDQKTGDEMVRVRRRKPQIDRPAHAYSRESKRTERSKGGRNYRRKKANSAGNRRVLKERSNLFN